MSKHPNIINVSQVSWDVEESGHAFASARKALGKAAGSKQLGCSLMRVPPGKAAWPKHAHFANEEAIYVLSGHGLLELGHETYKVGPRDYIALPCDPNLAHKLTNIDEDFLVYLCFSTMNQPDVMVYPDSKKVGFAAGRPPGGNNAKDSMVKFFPADGDVPYWTGE